MRPIPFERLTRWGGVAMLLLLIHAFSPSTAWAGCNHLVRSEADRLLDRNRLDPLITGESSDDPAGQPGPKQPAPCSGPGCSNQVPTPAPTPVPIPGGTDQWAALIGTIALPAASPLDRTTDEPAPASWRHECAVFHPPRI
jgi:hypothetical protein